MCRRWRCNTCVLYDRAAIEFEVWISHFADARTKVCTQAVEGLGRLDESGLFRSEVSGVFLGDVFLSMTAAANKQSTEIY